MSARSDIRWWSLFASQWNGTSMLVKFNKANPQIAVTSDASGSWGCGAYEGSKWIQFKWPPSMEATHIAIKEMIQVVMTAALWGRSWTGKSVRFWCDNSAVVALLNSGSSKEEYLMHLMRCLTFIIAKFNFVVSALHVRGIHNVLADALPRDHRDYFLSHYPQAQPMPTTIPAALVDLLITSKPDWTSTHWTTLWNCIFAQH